MSWLPPWLLAPELLPQIQARTLVANGMIVAAVNLGCSSKPNWRRNSILLQRYVAWSDPIRFPYLFKYGVVSPRLDKLFLRNMRRSWRNMPAKSIMYFVSQYLNSMTDNEVTARRSSNANNATGRREQ